MNLVDYEKRYHEFILICPNSNQNPYPATPEKLSQWIFHINSRNRTPAQEEIRKIKNIEADTMKDHRCFNNWGQMPAYMRHIYLKIADAFAGIQIAAVGSRIDGAYIESWDGEELRKYREDWGKSGKIQSDYDFTVLDKIDITLRSKRYNAAKAEAKEYEVDLLIMHLSKEKINVPMWDFSKLPEFEKANARKLFEGQEWGSLMALHNKYTLSENYYCCNELPIIRWFTWAADTGLI